MKFFATKVVRFLVAEDGPTAVEYAMLLMLVLLGVLTAVTMLGQSTSGNFQRSSDSMSTAFESH